MYVNTTAETKAETDYCVTSSNAAKVVQSLPRMPEILFGPDMFLGAHVERVTGRKMHVSMGECHVHAGIDPTDIAETMERHPDAELHVHPECGCSSQCMYLLSTGDLPSGPYVLCSVPAAWSPPQTSDAKEFIVATETGMLHRLRTENPRAEYIPANDTATCGFMKMIAPGKLLTCLQTGRDEVTVDPVVADRARLAIEHMIAIV